ncbi:MAG: hypothetical protein ACXAE3_03610 [Candidatus Kariarchaeaceae archaeon]
MSKEEFMDKLRATSFTTMENLVSLTVILVTVFFHLVFTMAFHIVG